MAGFQLSINGRFWVSTEDSPVGIGSRDLEQDSLRAGRHTAISGEGN